MIRRVFPGRITKISCESIYVSSNRFPKETEILRSVIDQLGQESAKAQSLSRVVTNFHRLRNSNHICYILTHFNNDEEKKIPIGLLKVGKKKLFLFDGFGECFEVEPICMLDFYVSTDFQRQGFGKELFEFMLKEENLDATDLPIDSPSPKMLAFMRKHFNQNRPLRQSNNFVVFPAFFQHVNRFLVPRRSLVRNNYALINSSQQSYSRSPEENCHKLRNVHSVAVNEEILTKGSGLSNSIPFVQNSLNSSPSDETWTKSKSEYLLADTHKEIGHAGIQSFRKLNFTSCSSSGEDLDNSMHLRNRQESNYIRSNPAARYTKRLEIAPPSNSSQNQQTLINSKIDTLLRWHERKPGYDCQKASWTNNRHTRLW